MIYVLVVVGYLSGYVGGPITTFQEFSTLDKCQVAMNEITKWVERDRHVHAFCVEK